MNQTGPSGTAKTSYAYDATGNTISRTISGDTQKLEWDPEGHLAKVTQPVADKPDEVTSYLYDADGNRLIARGPNETTVYLGGTELVLAKGATAPKATRYIDLGGGNQAVQSDDGKVSINVADHLGTGQLAISIDGLGLSQRRTLPFGGKRGESTGTWPGTKGYVGGTDDTETTGFIHLGAREYDSTTGRFISVDPVFDLADSQQMNGYAYSNNNPVTLSDPAGLCADIDCPTRPGPGYENTTPGHEPGGPKRSQNTAFASNHVSWSAPNTDTSPAENLIRTPAKKAEAIPAALAGDLYAILMWYIKDYREKAAAKTTAGLSNSNYTLVVSQVDVDEKLGEQGTSSRYIVFSSAGIPKDLEAELEKMGVAVIKAEKQGVHAEIVAGKYKADVNMQKQDLGGKIVKVHNAYVTTRICGAECSKSFSKFLGVPETEAYAHTNGVLYDRTVNKSYLNELRETPGRGRAMPVVTRAMAKGALPGQWDFSVRSGRSKR